MVLSPEHVTWLPLIPPGGVSVAIPATFPGQAFDVLLLWGTGLLFLKYVTGL
jgi:hypothetical protein